MSVWLIIALMWAVTYAVRFLGLNLGRLQLPPFWLAFLKYVPVSVFAALVVPDILASPEWPRRILAAIAGGFLMWRTRQLALGIMVGFAVYWGARLAGI